MISHRKIFELAWPYTLSMATAFIIQTVDSAMVAPMGSTALAALAIAASSAFLPNALTMGLLTAVQKRVAIADSPDASNRALSSGLMLGFLLALPFSILYFIFSQKIAMFFTQGPTADLAADYLKIFAPSFVFSAMNQSLNGYWIGALQSKTRLLITVCITAVNVTGNLLLIPHIGFTGVAVSSASAILFGFLMNLVLTRRLQKYRWAWPRRAEMADDLGTIFGVSLNQVSLAFSLNAAVYIVGMIGVDALAVANVVGTLSLPALYLGIGYGTATGSYLSRLFANQDLSEARKVGKMALLQVTGVSAVFAAALLLFSTPIRHAFFKTESSFALSQVPLLLLALLYIVDGLCCSLQRYHFVTNGVRFSLMTMSVVQWLLFIPAAWAGVHYLGIAYSIYFAGHLLQRLLVTAVLYGAWIWRTKTA